MVVVVVVVVVVAVAVAIAIVRVITGQHSDTIQNKTSSFGKMDFFNRPDSGTRTGGQRTITQPFVTVRCPAFPGPGPVFPALVVYPIFN